MPEENQRELSFQQLRKYPGFEHMKESELKSALRFIRQMVDVLHSANQD